MYEQLKIYYTVFIITYEQLHSMVLCVVNMSTGKLIYVTVRCMGPTFAMALSAIKWEPLYILETCEEQYAYYQTIIDKLMQMCFPTKVVSRHSSDKPWITDSFRTLVRKRHGLTWVVTLTKPEFYEIRLTIPFEACILLASLTSRIARLVETHENYNAGRFRCNLAL